MGQEVQLGSDYYRQLEVLDDREDAGLDLEEFIVGGSDCNWRQVAGQCEVDYSLVEEIEYKGVDADRR